MFLGEFLQLSRNWYFVKVGLFYPHFSASPYCLYTALDTAWFHLLWTQIPIWIVLVSPLMVSFKILGKNGFCFLLATAALRLVLKFCSFLFLVGVRPACHVAECPARKALLLLNKPTWLCFKTFFSLLIFLLPSMCTWWPNDFFGTLNNLWWWWLNFFAL